MIQTLKITGILTSLAAAAFLVLIAVKGMAADENIEKFLAASGVAEQLQGKTTTKKDDSGQDSLLVRQAKAFAARINPPPPPITHRRPKTTERSPVPRPKTTVSAKFSLVGTSYHIENEADSWALINEVGKGMHWVKQGKSVGRMIIEQIGDGVVLIKDGNKTYELTAQKEQKPNYVKSYSGTEQQRAGAATWKSQEQKTESQPEKQQKQVFSLTTQESTVTANPEISKEDIRENIEWVKSLRKNPESMGMTSEEAKELEGLGELLKSLEKDLAKIEPNDADNINDINDANNTNITKRKNSN